LAARQFSTRPRPSDLCFGQHADAVADGARPVKSKVRWRSFEEAELMKNVVDVGPKLRKLRLVLWL
jgi:hypothetical protein